MIHLSSGSIDTYWLSNRRLYYTVGRILTKWWNVTVLFLGHMTQIFSVIGSYELMKAYLSVDVVKSYQQYMNNYLQLFTFVLYCATVL